MIVLHVSRTPMVGVPAILTDLMNKYMGDVDAYCLAPERYNDRAVYSVRSAPLWVLDEADVVVIHNSPPEKYEVKLRHRPCVRMVHSQYPLIQGLRTMDWNIPFGVVAQYQPRFCPGEFFLLPNLLDIEDERFKPLELSLDRIRVAFFPSHVGVHGKDTPLWWCNKGVEETLAVLEEFDLDIDYARGMDYWECMRRRRRCHISIDECITGSYHRASLEAASMGKVAINNMDKETQGCLQEVTGSPLGKYPFLTAGIPRLREALSRLLTHRFAVNLIGQYARGWMEEFWHPRDLLERCYRPFLEAARVPAMASR